MDRVLILFLTQYYQVRLQDFEQLDPEHCTTDELLKMAAEASSLHKFSWILTRKDTPSQPTESCRKRMHSRDYNGF